MLGIEVSSESSWDSARAAFQSLPQHMAPGLALLAEMVQQPRFDAGEFDRLKAERLADILQARADPGRLADEMFLRHLFDADDALPPALGRDAGVGRADHPRQRARAPRHPLATRRRHT